MLFVLAMAFPVLLLLASLGMEHVERPLDRARVHQQIQRSLVVRDTDPAAIEELVANSFRTQIRQYWRRERRTALRTQRRAQTIGRRATPDLAPAPRGR